MKRMVLCAMVIAVFAMMSQAAVVAPNQTYTMTGLGNTETSTGPNGKYWEYDGVTMPNAYDTVVPAVTTVGGWYTQKYISDVAFTGAEVKYSYGFAHVYTDPVTVFLPSTAAYIDISTDNTNWTRVWSLDAAGWLTYFPSVENGNVMIPISFAATNTLYIKHGMAPSAGSAVYDGTWRMYPSWDPADKKGGVVLTPEPITISMLGLGGLLALRRRK